MVMDKKASTLSDFCYERMPLGALTLEQQHIMRGITTMVDGHRAKEAPQPTLGELLLDNMSRVGLPMNDEGLVTIEEWRKAISELGVSAEQHETDAVFDAIDVDGSGAIDPADIQELLWQGLQEPEEHKVAAGKFVAAGKELDDMRQARVRLQLRTGAPPAEGTRFAGIHDPTLTLTEVLPKLRAFLDRRRERLTDLFYNWDVNGDGFVVLGELIKGLQNMGIYTYIYIYIHTYIYIHNIRVIQYFQSHSF